MADAKDHDDELRVSDGIDDAIVTDANAVAVGLTRELLATGRTRISGQPANPGDKADTVFFLVHGFDFFGRGAFDDDSIACHAAAEL